MICILFVGRANTDSHNKRHLEWQELRHKKWNFQSNFCRCSKTKTKCNGKNTNAVQERNIGLKRHCWTLHMIFFIDRALNILLTAQKDTSVLTMPSLSNINNGLHFLKDPRITKNVFKLKSDGHDEVSILFINRFQRARTMQKFNKHVLNECQWDFLSWYKEFPLTHHLAKSPRNWASVQRR